MKSKQCLTKSLQRAPLKEQGCILFTLTFLCVKITIHFKLNSIVNIILLVYLRDKLAHGPIQNTNFFLNIKNLKKSNKQKPLWWKIKKKLRCDLCPNSLEGKVVSKKEKIIGRLCYIILFYLKKVILK